MKGGTAAEVQGLLALFGITTEGAIAKLETTIATTGRQLAQLDEQRRPLQLLFDSSRKQLAVFRGQSDEPVAPKAKRQAPAGEPEEVFDWDPATIEPRIMTGRAPLAPIRVSEFSSEKLARTRLAELNRVGYRYSTARPLRPGQIDFQRNRHGFFVLVNPLGGAQ